MRYSAPRPRAAWGLASGDRVGLYPPGFAVAGAPFKVSGIADLSRARPLFNSREGAKLEDFLYIPDSIVLSPRAFERIVVSGLR